MPEVNLNDTLPLYRVSNGRRTSERCGMISLVDQEMVEVARRSVEEFDLKYLSAYSCSLNPDA